MGMDTFTDLIFEGNASPEVSSQDCVSVLFINKYNIIWKTEEMKVLFGKAALKHDLIPKKKLPFPWELNIGRTAV